MKEKQRASTSQKISISVVSFFLAASIVLLSLIVIGDITLFNDREILSKVSQITYASQLNSDITLKCKSITDKYGVEYKAVADIITPSKIDTDMTVYFNSINTKDPAAAEKAISVDELTNQLYDSFLSTNKKMSDSEKAVAKKAASLIAQEYKKAIVLENLQTFYSFADEYRSVTVYIFIAFAIVFLVLVYVIIIKNPRRKKHRLLRRFSVVSCSAGLTVVIVSLVVKVTGIIERIAFTSSEREYNIFVKILDDFINSLILVGGCWVILGIVLMVLWYFSVVAGKRDSLFK